MILSNLTLWLPEKKVGKNGQKTAKTGGYRDNGIDYGFKKL